MRGWEWHLIRRTAPAKGFCQLRTAGAKGSRVPVVKYDETDAHLELTRAFARYPTHVYRDRTDPVKRDARRTR